MKIWLTEKPTHLCLSSHMFSVCFCVVKLLDYYELLVSQVYTMSDLNLPRRTSNV